MRAGLFAVCLGWMAAAAVLCGAPERVWGQGSAPSAPKLPEIRYVLDHIEVEGNAKTTSSVIASLSGVEPGERVGLEALERVRTRLLATGWFSAVEARLAKGSQRGHVVLWVKVRERNSILLNDVILGASKLHPFWGGLDIAEGNLLGRGLTLGGAFVAGDGQYGLRAQLADPYAFAAPLRLSGVAHHLNAVDRIYYADLVRRAQVSGLDPSLRYTRTGAEVGAGWTPFVLLGAYMDVGYDRIDAQSDDVDATQRLLREGGSNHTWVRLTFDHDTRDNPLVPTAGFRLNLALKASVDGAASDYQYARFLLRSNYHWQPGPRAWGHVLRVDLFGGIILGDAPLFERFFVGDVTSLLPGRDLELNFSSRAAPDYLNRGADALSYETMLAGGGIEYGIPLITGNAPLYRLEFFIGAGVFGMTSSFNPPDQRDANLGIDVRGSAQEDAFPLDLTFDLGFRAETPVGVFGLSFANGLALVPL